MNKYNVSTPQCKVLEQFLKENTTSAKNASIQTGLPIEAVCWYKRALRKLGKIAVVNMCQCPVTGKRVEYLTTNPDLFPKDMQLEIWD